MKHVAVRNIERAIQGKAYLPGSEEDIDVQQQT